MLFKFPTGIAKKITVDSTGKPACRRVHISIRKPQVFANEAGMEIPARRLPPSPIGLIQTECPALGENTKQRFCLRSPLLRLFAQFLRSRRIEVRGEPVGE